MCERKLEIYMYSLCYFIYQIHVAICLAYVGLTQFLLENVKKLKKFWGNFKFKGAS
jgi:hypothetical protein